MEDEADTTVASLGLLRELTMHENVPASVWAKQRNVPVRGLDIIPSRLLRVFLKNTADARRWSKVLGEVEDFFAPGTFTAAMTRQVGRLLAQYRTACGDQIPTETEIRATLRLLRQLALGGHLCMDELC